MALLEPLPYKYDPGHLELILAEVLSWLSTSTTTDKPLSEVIKPLAFNRDAFGLPYALYPLLATSNEDEQLSAAYLNCFQEFTLLLKDQPQEPPLEDSKIKR